MVKEWENKLDELVSTNVGKCINGLFCLGAVKMTVVLHLILIILTSDMVLIP